MNKDISDIHELEVITPKVNTIAEVENILFNSIYKKEKIVFNERGMFFTKESRNDGLHEYWVQRRENEMYGWVMLLDGTWIPSYPHLNNIYKDEPIRIGYPAKKPQITVEDNYLELKLNGTNICMGCFKYKRTGNRFKVIRTRMSPFPDEFPVPTFWNETINGIKDKSISTRLSNLRSEMLSKYPEFYINSGEGEYIGLKVNEVVNHILNVNEIVSFNPDYSFYFELCGKINPIIIDSEVTYGLYDFDYKMYLIDIYSRELERFLSRSEKESIAVHINLEIVPIYFRYTNIKDLLENIPRIKSEADNEKIEGFVLKNGKEIIKVKPDSILESAYRLNSLLKGFIYLPDLLNYISKVVSMESLSHPEEYTNLVEQIVEEAKADYPDEVVDKNYHEIQRRIAHNMAILTTEKIMQERTFKDNDELFSFLNLEIPRTFYPLRSYMDFELEKNTDDIVLREKLRRKRVDMFSRVAKYCLKKYKEGHLSYVKGKP